jgi:hypothetical protein
MRLFAKALVLKGGRISETREPLPQSIGYLRVCGYSGLSVELPAPEHM